MIEKVVISRHSMMKEHLRRKGVALDSDMIQLGNAQPEDIVGRHVFGVLPLHLAALAVRVTEVPVITPPELRRHHLTLEQLEMYSKPLETYVVRRQGGVAKLLDTTPLECVVTGCGESLYTNGEVFCEPHYYDEEEVLPFDEAGE